MGTFINILVLILAAVGIYLLIRYKFTQKKCGGCRGCDKCNKTCENRKIQDEEKKYD